MNVVYSDGPPVLARFPFLILSSWRAPSPTMATMARPQTPRPPPLPRPSSRPSSMPNRRPRVSIFCSSRLICFRTLSRAIARSRASCNSRPFACSPPCNALTVKMESFLPSSLNLQRRCGQASASSQRARGRPINGRGGRRGVDRQRRRGGAIGRAAKQYVWTESQSGWIQCTIVFTYCQLWLVLSTYSRMRVSPRQSSKA